MVSRVAKFVETGRRMVVARGRGREEWGVSVSWVQDFSLRRCRSPEGRWW